MSAPLRPGKARRDAQAPEHDAASKTRTIVLGPYLTRAKPARADAKADNPRPPESRLEEAVGLAAAIDLTVAGAFVVPLSTPRPATFLGSGKVTEIQGIIAAEDAGLVVMDCALSPVQQRNLEKAWGVKVIDRTGLILEIFGRRARTREGALQVEHAHLAYQKSRLVRSWTHLERQRGGFGFLGGPGETQIEADRRVILERMKRIERDLDAVMQTRSLHRQSRERVPYPTIALIGYTNAGKSTLFNRLAKAEVMAENMLFATLDPTTRVIRMPHGDTAILSDTVGFISDLPTMLVAAFRATLEDVVEADLLLHVRDISHGETAAEAADVETVLRELGVDPGDRERLIEVWNKADLIPAEDRSRLLEMSLRRSDDSRPSLVSALTGEGLDDLRALIESRIARGRPVFRIALDSADGGGLNWLYEQAEILSRYDEGGIVGLVVRIAPEKEPRLVRRFAQAERLPPPPSP